MKCSIMLHFIWVSIVCQPTILGVSSLQKVKGVYLYPCHMYNVRVRMYSVRYNGCSSVRIHPRGNAAVVQLHVKFGVLVTHPPHDELAVALSVRLLVSKRKY